ncbi:hypothetical protein [uncultured Aliiroseovarius sp.]|uniref:hypothetical protein n=1 Tax=uncultured Aliiroseovarius sp. TaxID=1658783 RepID=UPI00262CE347|nr:hypothetical protein [uncultured Aliiroseovarius sp.]
MDQLTRAQCQHSLDLLVGQEREIADAFFPLLFERAPELKAMFPKGIDDPMVQTHTLYQMIIAFVGDEQALATKLQVLGFRMAMRGMYRDHADILVNTLIGSLKRQLKQSWQSDFAYAWRIAKMEALRDIEAGAVLMAA